jgi:hypothetical protein
LSTSLAGDLLQQMGAFGISNYLIGIMLILIGWKAPPLTLTMLGGFLGIAILLAAGTVPISPDLDLGAVLWPVHRHSEGAGASKHKDQE